MAVWPPVRSPAPPEPTDVIATSPIPDDHRFDLELFLVPQTPATPDDGLHCMFCTKLPCEWETAYWPQGKGKFIAAGICEGCRSSLRPFEPKRDPIPGFVHVDDFIDSHRQDPYARFVLDYFRRSAVSRIDFEPFMRAHQLFCSWGESRYRVTGASRMGDIWLSSDHRRGEGYEHRVNVAECYAWSCKP